MEDAGTLVVDRHSGQLDGDDDLALAARADPAAFAELYERHRLTVFRYLRTRTRTDDDAAELTAVTFERTLAGISKYRPMRSGVLAWILRIARNAAIDAGRRSHGVPLIADMEDARSSSDPEAGTIRRERRADLVAAVGRLPDVQREALALRYASGLTAREIGDVLGKSEHATQKLISRALATLRKDYRDDR